ncbi:neutral/alkaline non-lysosomal ceramidase N-terminal domain-containing protein [Candidatus Bathyarchaeota archaeon]|nr:neutral/alkaline non-lysosomal ceramidase N-terminal domain-containing protein [Candidatus Bathyarchaeota archaeon]
MGILRAWASKVEITPPVGIPLGGFAARTAPSQGLNDGLYAKALALNDDRTTAILIVADVLTLPSEIVEGVRASVRRNLGINPTNVMVAATHTHSGPETLGIFASLEEPLLRAYMKVLEAHLAGVTFMAFHKMAEASFGVGKGRVRIGFNRRKPEGPVDEELGVIRLDNALGVPKAAIVNYSCHPVVLGSENLFISADYPGYMSRAFEGALGGGFTSIFTNGAAGDVNPISCKGYACPGSFRDAHRLGSILAGEAIKVLEESETSHEVCIQTSSEVRWIVLGEPPVVQAEHSLKEEKERLEELRRKGAPQEDLARHEAILRYYERNLELLRKEPKELKVPLEVQVLRINDVALVGVPGELFVEIGLEIKAKSPLKNTFIVGYAGGYVGYMPTRKAFEEGGYEPTRTWWNRTCPEIGEVVKESALRQLETLSAN